jgi:hypothetical protein
MSAVTPEGIRHGVRVMAVKLGPVETEKLIAEAKRDCFASLAMTAHVVIERQALSLRGAGTATKQSPPRGGTRRPK